MKFYAAMPALIAGALLVVTIVKGAPRPRRFGLFLFNRRCDLNLDSIQAALRSENIEAWLFFDHHHRDPIAYRILNLASPGSVTRRWYYLVPAEGAPRGLVHAVEPSTLDELPGEKVGVFRMGRATRRSPSPVVRALSRGHAVFALVRRPLRLSRGWRDNRSDTILWRRDCFLG